jgi:hypothetical protein
MRLRHALKKILISLGVQAGKGVFGPLSSAICWYS